MDEPLIIGFGSRARVGKDHACKVILKAYPDISERFAFADALKSDINAKLNPEGIDVYTTDPHHKEQIRPLLVGYGMTMRNIDPDYWIKRAFKEFQYHKNFVGSCCIPLKIAIFTDVRFPNEVKAIQGLGGKYVHIVVPNQSYINAEEALYSPQCYDLANHYVHNFHTPEESDPGFDEEVLSLVKMLLINKQREATKT